MVSDWATDTVYISDLLPKRHPEIVAALRATLSGRLQTIPGTKDIWVRDFMPIQLPGNRFVVFRYAPDYLKDYPHVRTDDGASLLDLDCVRSELVIDGGNVVRFHDTAIMTGKIYRENPNFERPRLRDELRRLLEVERLIVIPKEPYDKIGHADGMVRFVNDKTVLVNDYGMFDAAFGERLAVVLGKHGFDLIPFPHAPTYDAMYGISSAEGVYINFLQIDGAIFFPTFNGSKDDQAMNILGRCFPTHTIIPIPSADLAVHGGVLNCATWNVKNAKDEERMAAKKRKERKGNAGDCRGRN